MIIAIQQSEHAPWLGFFGKMSKVDKYVLLDNVQFKKRYFENRNKIRTLNGWQWVTVPVVSKGCFTQRINEVKIDNTQEWRRKYLNSLKYTYAKAPYFNKYTEDITKIISSDWEKLADLNIELISFFRDIFNLNHIPMVRASALKVSQDNKGSNLILKICVLLEAKTYISGPDGARYLKSEDFMHNGINIKFHEYIHPIYNQLHKPFISHMSSFDFLFNCGARNF